MQQHQFKSGQTMPNSELVARHVKQSLSNTLYVKPAHFKSKREH